MRKVIEGYVLERVSNDQGRWRLLHLLRHTYLTKEVEILRALSPKPQHLPEKSRVRWGCTKRASKRSARHPRIPHSLHDDQRASENVLCHGGGPSEADGLGFPKCTFEVLRVEHATCRPSSIDISSGSV